MVRINKIILLLLAVPVIGYSQQKKQSKFGVIAGLAYNTQVNDSTKVGPISYAKHNLFSPYAGFIYRDSINKWLSLVTKLYYVQRGVRFNENFVSPTFSETTKQLFVCHYVSFPINLRFHIKKFFIGAGVEGSILLTGLTYFDDKLWYGPGYPVIHSVINRYDGSKVYRPVDAGYSFSLGYRFKYFELEASMFHGLIVPPKFSVYGYNDFAFRYAYQQTFMLGINYFPSFKKRN